MPAIANRMAARAKRQNDPDVSFARGGGYALRFAGVSRYTGCARPVRRMPIFEERKQVLPGNAAAGRLFRQIENIDTLWIVLYTFLE